MTDKLVLAIPSKGRLMEAAEEYFSSAGLKIKRTGGDRRYQGFVKGMQGVEVRFLSAAEIASGLVEGTVHLGITGRDLLHEKVHEPDRVVAPLSALNFGYADVVIAVPEAWLDVETVADLAEVASEIRHESGRMLRVATKFTNITRAWFADHGIVDYRIVESLGATEGAPAAGTAEAIVDITSTGATLTANHLKILKDGVMLKSEAFLCGSLGASWTEPVLATAQTVLGQLGSRERARSLTEVRVVALAESVEAVGQAIAMSDAEVIHSRKCDGDICEFVLHARTKGLHELSASLRSAGATSVTARELEFIYGESNPLFETLELERTQATGH